MEEDVEPKDEDGVDGRGVSGWDGWVCGLGVVGASSVFGFRISVRVKLLCQIPLLQSSVSFTT